jgi:hypothetical protein
VPNNGRKFAFKYQDRILFGTDGAVTDPALYRAGFRTLGTDDFIARAIIARAKPRLLSR